MTNFFLELYNQLKTMNMDGRDLDGLLNSLPWKEKERLLDGTVIYTCEIFDEKK